MSKDHLSAMITAAVKKNPDAFGQAFKSHMAEQKLNELKFQKFKAGNSVTSDKK